MLLPFKLGAGGTLSHGNQLMPWVHIKDVIKKSLKLFDKIVVGVSDESNKHYLFSSNERIEIVNKALFKDLKLNKKKIKVVSFVL